MDEISVKEFEKIISEGGGNVVFIDVRTPGEYRACHIKGLKNIPIDLLANHIEDLKKYDTVYVSCGSGMRSQKGCEALKASGLRNIVNVAGGLAEWQKSGYPVERGKGVISIMRQVQIIAGGLVLLSAFLAYFWDFNFILLAGFVGAGLLFAGLSGTCAMAVLLQRMPWNK